MNKHSATSGWMILVCALSLSIGWGIRGNFGHEYGAMIPGALASMAAALLSGRADWWERVAHFGFFGALGWSFGGSMSYMQVIAYTHSGHSASVLYGFACLFLIGFLWAAIGGAGAALPATLDRERLDEFFAPLTAVFVAWCLQDFAVSLLENRDPQFRQASPLYWYDTDWLAALVAIAAVVMLALARRRVDAASSLILHMAIGWWICFLLLVIVLGWRMTPPRGDNWAGCVGMVAGLWTFLQRRRWVVVTVASVITGFVGGFGFATATLLKLLEVKSGWQTNWHSVLEQTYGLINGVGLGVAMMFLARRARPLSDTPAPNKAGTTAYATAFVLLAITYLNLRKNPAVWVQAKALPATLGGLSAEVWFNLGYLVLAIAVVTMLVIHRHRRIALIPESALGRGQLLFVVFLWWMVIGNLERALVGFAPQRLVTEGVIHVNAALCTLLVLFCPTSPSTGVECSLENLRALLKRTAAWGTIALVLTVAADWAIVRAVYGDQFAGYAARHIRFGPNATATKEKPRPDQPHP
jgi:hypothetical protein